MSYNTVTNYTAHFTKDDFNKAGIPVTDAQHANAHLLCNNILEPTRAHFGGKPMIVTRLGGIRSYAQQAALYAADLAAHGGKPSGLVAHPDHAQHCLGKAADTYIEGVPNLTLAEYYCTLPTVGGVGIYDWGVHVDERPREGGVIAKWGMWPGL